MLCVFRQYASGLSSSFCCTLILVFSSIFPLNGDEPSSLPTKLSEQASSAALQQPSVPNKKDATSLEAPKTATTSKSEANITAIPANVERPIRIGVTFMLNNINKIDEKIGNFEGSIDLHLRWVDPNQKFDPKTIGTFRQSFCFEEATEKLSKMWNPRIKITNIIGKPIADDLCLVINSDGAVEYVQRITALFDTKFNLVAFPFDEQKLLVKLISTRYNSEELEFVQSEEEIYHSGIREGTSLIGWSLKDVDYDTSRVRGLDGHFFPLFVAEIVMTRDYSSHLFAFAPLLLIVIIPSILTLYNKSDVGALLGAWSGAILALIALSFTLNLRYPALGSDSLMARLIAIIFAYEFFMICVSISILNPTVIKKFKNPRVQPEILKFMQWGIPLIFMLLVAFTVLSTLFY